MSPVFSHGQLRLYLLKLLADGPKHGYELIRLVAEIFHGLYAPSAGTIYPRLARMEADGLISHTASGGRKIYHITAAGHSELDQRAGELAALTAEIDESAADLVALAEHVERDVRGSVRDLKQELREAKQSVRSSGQTWGLVAQMLRTAGRPFPPPAESASLRADPLAQPDATGSGDDAAGAADAGEIVVGKASELAEEVGALVASARATVADLRIAATVLDSVRDQLRRILRG